MFTVNDEEFKQMQSDLERFAQRGIPFATNRTINGIGFGRRL